ncbi:MAG: tRNA 2-thiouridine(34) synthase MnmA [Bacteroidaceae bacterium]|nr:tRNA 2-thiouridine(34) synthase MnmA [Bacteroidaceae bacterium]
MNFESIKGSVAVLISGGVDSAVVVHLLCEAGLKPDLHYIKIGMDGEDSSCTAEEDIELSEATARKYGLRLEVTDLQKEYWEQVVGYAIERVKKGLTPNPDVMCNRLIKFGAFEEKVGRHYDYIATGHYATNVIRDGKMWLGTAKDPVKDQTDFLAQLSYEQLSHTLFPIGPLMKEEVRQIALDAKLPSARRKDSQGICFLGKINYNDFLRRFMGEQEGKIIDIETNKVIGTHKGYWFHTIGQRKGLGLSGGPWFVVKKNIRKNIIFVANGWDTQLQYGHDFRLADFHFITENPFQPGPTPNPSLVGSGEDSSCRGESNHSSPYKGEVGRGSGLKRLFPIQFKVRHVDHFMPGTISLDDEGYHIHSDAPIQGIAPGQFGCIYDADATVCYGSGEISIYKDR